MNPGRYDLNLYRGDSYAWRFTLWKDAAKTDEVDLAGSIVSAQIRDKPAGSKIVQLTCDVTTPNIVDMQMTPSMYDLCPPKGVWDLEITFADEQVQTPLAGQVIVTADVTNSG